MLKRIKKILIVLFIITISIPDIPFIIYNVLLGGLIYFVGWMKGDPVVMQYGKNIAVGSDQFSAAKHFGLSTDVTISHGLGVAKKKYAEGTATVDRMWLFFAKFVNCLFWFQKDHSVESIEEDEDMSDGVFKFHHSIEPTKIKKG